MKSARLLAPVAALVLLVGCNAPSTAFTVEGKRTTLNQVQAAQDDCRSTFPGASERELELAMVNSLLSGVLADQLTQKVGVQVTDEQRQQVMSAYQIDPAKIAPECLRHLNGRFNLQYLVGTGGTDKVSQLLSDVDVVVNPVLGKYDPNSMLVGQTSTSMSKPGPVFGD